jgi:large subunit GTPase 1
MIEEETTLIARRLVGQSIDGEKPTADLRVLSCPELYELFESFRRHSSTSDDENDGGITIGLVGYPNVGKSSTINALVGQKKVTVSATPGKTKHFQTIVLSDSVTLCDCPGLVFPMFATTKAEMVCNGVLPIDQLREYSGPSTLVCQRIPRFYLEWRYGISLPRPDESEQEGRPPTSAELLCTYAAMRGFRKAGQGNPDESRAARIILKDYVKGELLFCHAPPGADQRLFNEENYREGGLKFVESQLAKDVLANRKTNESAGQHLPQTRKANTDGAASNSRHLDKEFFADKQAGKVHTLGKNASNDFSRADLLPKQNDDVKMGSARSPSGSGSSIDMQRLRDKKHKSTKRGKDRSWRVD